MTDEPIQPLPAGSTLDPRKVRLGAQLFADRRLSGNGGVSCASCHDLSANGASSKAQDAVPFGRGMARNTPTLFNSALNFRQFWDGRVGMQDVAIGTVIENPLVMHASLNQVVARLRADPAMVGAFGAVYPGGLKAAAVSDAMATFLQSLRTPGARIDRYLSGDASALTSEEQRGYRLFKAYGCVACHQGANIGGNMFQVMGVMGERGGYFTRRPSPSTDKGRFDITGLAEDMFVFRVPSLRNVAVTAPYFHDGSARTLPDAVRAMFEYQLGRNPSPEDVALIVKFLGTLTGTYEGHPLKAPGSP